MSKSEKYTVNELLNNDEFITWINSGKEINDRYWKEIKKDLSAEEKINFSKAEQIIKKIRSLNVDKANVSPEFIQEQYIRLLEASSKPQNEEGSTPRVFKLNTFLKYAAAVVLLISLSGVIYNTISTKNSFSEHLLVSEFNSDDILLQVSKNKFYKITDSTNNKWLTSRGEFVSIDSGNISFIASDDISEGEEMYKLYVPAGKKFHLTLIDGTEVELNSNSTIAFNNSTISNQRNVNLTGEGFFDVAHNENRPFVVQSSDVTVEVLGTEFNISNYANDGYVRATLVDGSIKIANTTGGNKVIKPGEQATIYDDEDKINIQQADVQEAVAWTSGRMIFRNETLESLIPKMNRWFDVEFVILDKNLKDYRFTGTLKKENDLTHYLQILKYTEGISYKIENKQVKLFVNEDQ
ncbi:MAG: FecR domain-containing protein [Bacteroidota bacterium]